MNTRPTSPIESALNEANTALAQTHTDLRAQKGMGQHGREALQNNYEHAHARLFDAGGFVERIQALPGAAQQIATAEAFLAEINKDVPERTASTALQQAFVSRFTSALRHAAETIEAPLPIISGPPSEPFPATVPTVHQGMLDPVFPKTVKQPLSADLAEAATVRMPLDQTPISGSDFAYAPTVRMGLRPAEGYPKSRTPASAPRAEANAQHALASENIRFAVQEAITTIAPTVAKCEAAFRLRNAAVFKSDPATANAALIQRVENATDFLLNPENGVASKLKRAQSVNEVITVLKNVAAEKPRYGKTMQLVIDTYVTRFSSVLGAREPHFFAATLENGQSL